MAEFSGRDAALLLDTLLAAQDALSFIAGLDEIAFHASRPHETAEICSLEVIGEAAGKVSAPCRDAIPKSRGATLLECGTG